MKVKTSIYLVLLPVLILMLNLNCKKDNSSTSNNSGSVQNIKVISEQIWNKNFVSMDSTSKTMVFAKNLDAGQPIQVGDILVSAVGDGFLRKVKTVTTTNDKIQIQTDPAYLTEAVKEGVVKFDQTLTVRQIKKIQLHYEGIKLITNNNKSFTSFPLEVNTVLYDADHNLSTTYDQVKLIGSFNCDWHITGLIDIGLLSGLKEVKFSFESNENADLQLVLRKLNLAAYSMA